MESIEILLGYNSHIFDKIDKFILVFYQKIHLAKYSKVLDEFKNLVDLEDVLIESSNTYEPYIFLERTHGEDDYRSIEINWRTNNVNNNYLENFIHCFYDTIRCSENCKSCFEDSTKIYYDAIPIPHNYWYTYPTKESLKVLNY